MHVQRLITVGLLGIVVAAGCAGRNRPAARPPFPAEQRAAAAEIDPTGFLEQYAATFRFRLGRPSRISITPEGDQILFLRSGPRSFSQDLWAHDPLTGEERVILRAEDLLEGREEDLTPEELARRERTRSAARGIASYELSKDGSTLLIGLSGDLYLVDRDSLQVSRFDLSSDGRGAPIDPHLSPERSRIACIREGELWVIDVSTGTMSQITTGSGDTITNATAEFVAQEEMRRRRGYWWSPDERLIAYQQNDESEVETLSIMDPKDPGKPPRSWRYPRAGTPNADVRLGVIPVEGGQTVWVDWDRVRFPYLATVKWPRGAPLTILVQNREQTEQLLLRVDHATGSTTELLAESDPAWLRLDQRFPHWLEDGSGFLWKTERNGAWQIERRSRSGDLEMALNRTDQGLLSMAHVDEDSGVVYVVASTDPTQRHVGMLRLNGPAEQSVDLLTSVPGVHSAAFADNADLLVHTSSAGNERTVRYVRRITERGLGPPLSELRSVAERPSVRPLPEWVTTTTSPPMHAVVLRPTNYDPQAKHPVILHVYGGPTSQMVMRSRDRYLLQQWLAEQGYIVVSIDARGTPARGRDWLKITKGNLIDIPLDDQIKALSALGRRFPEMDLSRVGVFGWSFGGYFSAMAAMRRPDVFRAGIAGAPVCDWLDYDTHYTERYLGVPPADQHAYDISNVLTYAPELRVPLLIIHGTADDNVYLTHSLKMTDALFRAGAPYEFLPLSGFTHMVTEPEATRRMYERMVRFLDEHVNGGDAHAVAQ